MASYSLVVKKSVAKDLEGIPKKDILRILACLQGLADNPRPAGCEKLSGQERYRIRQGVYRVIYEITDRQLIVTVVKIVHRSQVYRKP
ncbi:type II toxin-antitoxin system RelE family toxin [Pseudidiomarina mangrovi]|uniref:type II toxin-antitoxin system RelE family toxin n=1 Tax=Pseudidiomarina mangrovi TaxID=2487133 RepID=UPI000FCCA75B|nr:type II toxin-antitoxin system RelE/ParE family toxin [Pseudidiomarina mangrovi]